MGTEWQRSRLRRERERTTTRPRQEQERRLVPRTHDGAVRHPQPRLLVRGLPGPAAYRQVTPQRPGPQLPQIPSSAYR
jgi:hypothetical protein